MKYMCFYFRSMQFGEKRKLLVVGMLLISLALVQAADPSSGDAPHIRHKRGIFWDFFQKMVITKNLIVDVSCNAQLRFLTY